MYNLKDLESEITENKELIETSNKDIETFNKDLSIKDDEVKVAEGKKEKLLSQKIEVDDEIEDVNPQTLQGEIDGLIADGVSKKKDLDKTLMG
jgi:phosphorylcholine metabolism protein LicD